MRRWMTAISEPPLWIRRWPLVPSLAVGLLFVLIPAPTAWVIRRVRVAREVEFLERMAAADNQRRVDHIHHDWASLSKRGIAARERWLRSLPRPLNAWIEPLLYEPNALQLPARFLRPFAATSPGGPPYNLSRAGRLDGLAALAVGYSSNPIPLLEVDWSVLQQLPQLESLTIENAKFTDADAVHVSRLKRLKQLVIRNVPVSDRGMEFLSRLPRLEHLEIERFSGSAAGLVHLGKLSELEILSIESAVPVTGSHPAAPAADFRSWQSLTRLNVLRLPNHPGCAPLPSQLRFAPLAIVDFPSAAIDDSNLDAYVQLLERASQRPLTLRGKIWQMNERVFNTKTFDLRLPFPEYLILSQSQVTDASCASLARITGLKHLDLSGTRVTNAGVRRLAAAPELTWLSLRGTQIDDAAAPLLREFPSLKAVDVSETQVSEQAIAQGGENPRVNMFSDR